MIINLQTYLKSLLFSPESHSASSVCRLCPHKSRRLPGYTRMEHSHPLFHEEKCSSQAETARTTPSWSFSQFLRFQSQWHHALYAEVQNSWLDSKEQTLKEKRPAIQWVHLQTFPRCHHIWTPTQESEVWTLRWCRSIPWQVSYHMDLQWGRMGIKPGSRDLHLDVCRVA